MMIYDIHSHILPGVDDGAFSMDESLQMAETAERHRGRCMVCTPHWFPGCPYNRQALIDVYRRTAEAVRNRGLHLRLALGQELLLDESYRSTVAMLERGELFTISRSVYPLVEFDPQISGQLVGRIIEAMTAAGFVPIIAHPERYGFAADDYEMLHRMKSMGALLQIDKGSLSGMFGRRSMRAGEYLLENRLADFAASDAHSPYRRTPPLDRFHEWVSQVCSVNYADHLMCGNPRRVLKNEKIFSYSAFA